MSVLVLVLFGLIPPPKEDGSQRTGACRSITEADLQRLNVHLSSRQQWIDEVQAEISMCLGMLYPIMEVFRNDDEFAEELSTCPLFPLHVPCVCKVWWTDALLYFALPCLAFLQ